MRTIRRLRPSPATVIAIAALAVAIGGVAYATIPDSAGTIHACYAKANGGLRVVESDSECRSSERVLTWSSGGTASGARTSGLVRLTRGSEATLLQDGPFTWTAKCLAEGTETEVQIVLDSTDRPFVWSQGETQVFNGPTLVQQETTQSSSTSRRFWAGGLPDTVAAASGASRDFIHSVGVEVFGSDCVARVTVIG